MDCANYLHSAGKNQSSSYNVARVADPHIKDRNRTERTGSGQKEPDRGRKNRIVAERTGTGQKGPDPEPIQQ